jgi:hypothetical protein
MAVCHSNPLGDTSFGHLNEYFVGLDHAQLISGAFFHHVQAFFEVIDLGNQLVNFAVGCSGAGNMDEILSKLPKNP